MSEAKHDNNDFASEARRRRTGLIGQFFSFLAHNKKWWLLPILLALLLVALLAVLVSTAAGPFIYPLF